MKQEAARGDRSPPSTASALFAVEIVPPKLPAYELIIDDVSFVK